VEPPAQLNIALLAEHPELVPNVGEMRWREWGYGEDSPERWTDITVSESGRDYLPVTLVAIDASGHASGAVALGDADDALTDQERSDRSPWLLGLVVAPSCRQQGVGRRLVTALEDLARDRGFPTVWVATGDDAAEFYRRCGWSDDEELILTNGGWLNYVLSKRL
jgi:GNAT superfamily N-acetyltransferase